MTWFAFGFSAVEATIVAALMFAMPQIARRTTPLGVSVPTAHLGDAVIAAASRRYRAGVAVSWLVALGAGGALAAVRPALAVALPVFVAVIGAGLAYVLARRAIVAAKRDEGWYEGVPVRLVAEVSAARTPLHPPYPFAAVAVLLLAVAAAVGVAVYPTLPDPVPVHWGLDGQANGWSAKSVWSVFGVLLVALGIDTLLFVLSLAGRMPMRGVASDDPEQAARRAAAQSRVLGSSMGMLIVALALTLSAAAVVGWTRPGDAVLMNVATVATLAFLFAVVIVMIVRLSRVTRSPMPVTARDGGTGRRAGVRADAPDDDRYWRGGLLYINRSDPAVFVPKRFGVGWTVNLGSPGGIALGVVLLALLAAAVVVPVVAGR